MRPSVCVAVSPCTRVRALPILAVEVLLGARRLVLHTGDVVQQPGHQHHHPADHRHVQHAYTHTHTHTPGGLGPGLIPTVTTGGSERARIALVQ